MNTKIGRWEALRGYVTPGGTPIYVCAKCGKSQHLYGVEYHRRKVFCEDCGTVNLNKCKIVKKSWGKIRV